jgi:hypothetical protein
MVEWECRDHQVYPDLMDPEDLQDLPVHEDSK